MATCDTQTLVEDGACFDCFDRKQMELAKLALLCRILQNLDPMATCDPATLMDEGACFGCLDDRQLKIAELQLLCNIAGAGGGGGGGIGGENSGPADPVAAPVAGNGLWYNTTTGTFWVWDTVLAAWVPLIT